MEGCLAAQRKGPAEAVLRDRPFFRKTWNECALLVCRKKRFGSLKTAEDIAGPCGLDTGDFPWPSHFRPLCMGGKTDIGAASASVRKSAFIMRIVFSVVVQSDVFLPIGLVPDGRERVPDIVFVTSCRRRATQPQKHAESGNPSSCAPPASMSRCGSDTLSPTR
jgi:hypothetical protein